jgi:3-hydroxyacyl-[acyl-carrier-protein] dehydratase
MPPRPLIDLSRIDPNRVVADIEEIRRANPQRFEFEQLSWVCHLEIAPDKSSAEGAAVLEIPKDPFWARGHVPGRPLMPGVLMIEAAAQLAAFANAHIHDASQFPGRIFGFAAVDSVKFRGSVQPGQRLLIVGKSVDIRPRRGIFDTQAYVEGELVFEGRITGMWV